MRTKYPEASKQFFQKLYNWEAYERTTFSILNYPLRYCITIIIICHEIHIVHDAFNKFEEQGFGVFIM